MTAIEIEPWERIDPMSQDPADIIAAQHEATERVTRIIASLRAPWMRDALCTEFDLALWFPSRGQSNQPALDICGRCPVRTECLNEALLDSDLDHGIRGGMTANARQAARRTRGITPITRNRTIRSCIPGCRCDVCRQQRADATRRWRARTGRTGPC